MTADNRSDKANSDSKGEQLQQLQRRSDSHLPSFLDDRVIFNLCLLSSIMRYRNCYTTYNYMWSEVRCVCAWD